MITLCLGCLLACQDPPPVAPPAPAAELGTRFDERGWPIVEEGARSSEVLAPVPLRGQSQPVALAAPTAAIAPALDAMFAQVGSPAAFRALGGLGIWWRITVHGPQGETIGVREVTQTCDAGAPESDRLEFTDGRVCGRLGPTVFAERHGLPWPTLVESSTQDLALFGLHARLPWILTDRSRYSEAAAAAKVADGALGACVRLVARRASFDGPEPAAAPMADAIEIWCRSSGPPLQFAHAFASSGQRRTVRLEDWRTVGAVSMPYRRIYVDAEGRPTTTLEVLRIESNRRVSDRDFRLH